MTDTPLLDWKAPSPLPFAGATYDAERDEKRLGAQLSRLLNAMRSGDWFTPEELERATGDRWASLSARIRDCRKVEFHIPYSVERESIGGGLFQYRLVRREA